MSQPLFSVVVPTCDRAETLYWCLRSFDLIDYDNYEILVMDNGSVDRTFEVVSELSATARLSNRLRYVRAPRLSMSQNWERALDHVAGRFAIVIGDDDGIAPYALKAVEAILDRYDCTFVGGTAASFYWNDTALWNQEVGGMLAYNWEPFYFHQRLEETTSQPRTCAFSIYDSFVSVAFIREIQQRHGHYFSGAVPDIASSLQNRLSGLSAASMNWPLAIRGYSRHSSNGHCRSNNADHIPNFLINNTWEPEPLLPQPADGSANPFLGYWNCQTKLRTLRLVKGQLSNENYLEIIKEYVDGIIWQLTFMPELKAIGTDILAQILNPSKEPNWSIPIESRSPHDMTRAASDFRIDSQGCASFCADLRPIAQQTTIADAVRFLASVTPAGSDGYFRDRQF